MPSWFGGSIVVRVARHTTQFSVQALRDVNAWKSSSAALKWIKGSNLARKYLQFSLVGSSGVLLDMICIYLLASPSTLSLNVTLSKVVAAEIALLSNFIWNDVWTFRLPSCAQNGFWARAARFLKFNLICSVGIGLSVLLLKCQVSWLGWNLYFANFNSIVVVSIWNFILNLRFGWNVLSKPARGD